MPWWNAAAREIHDAGQVSILLRLHTTLDEAVADAYHWPVNIAPADIVARIVTLNIERQEEERAGTVRGLRAEFQAPTEQRRATQTAMPVDQAEETGRPKWPARDPDRFVALRAILATSPGKPAELTKHFDRAPAAKIREMLQTLAALGQARQDTDGSYHL